MRLAADNAFSPFQGHNHQKWRNHPHVFGIHPRDRAPATSVPGKSHVGLAECPGVRAGPGLLRRSAPLRTWSRPTAVKRHMVWTPPRTFWSPHPGSVCDAAPTPVNLLWWLIFSHLWPVEAMACSVSFNGLVHTM